ncbi:MAG: hypothetical protein Q9190_003909, partial [Brigantiaea leucoxantha]
MFDSICTFPLSSDLFAQSIHPNSPYLALGLATGHVQLQRLPPLLPGSSESSPPYTHSNGYGTIETAWRTRRHHGSCRSLAFSTDGDLLFSAGSDGIVKCAVTETGRVVAKVVAPGLKAQTTDTPCLVHALTAQTFLLATDSSALHIYDLRSGGSSSDIFSSPKPHKTFHPHDDYISSLQPLAPSETSTSGFSRSWLSTGGSTAVISDLRKGVVAETEDLGEELLCGIVVQDGSWVMVGGERGVLRSWRMDKAKGFEGDEDMRAQGVQKGESLDVACMVPGQISSPKGEIVAVGVGDGT